VAARGPAELQEAAAGLATGVRDPVAAAVASGGWPGEGGGRLVLNGQYLEDAGARALAAHLRRQRALPVTYLSLATTDLTAAGAGMVFGAVLRRGCPGLKTVCVSFNQSLGARGLAHILAALGPLLETIDFGGYGVGDDGFEALATAMPRLTGLKRVYAHGNACGDGGARAMAAAVRGVHGLEALQMYGNPAVGAAAAAELREAAAAAGVGEYRGPGADDESSEEDGEEHDDY
jgi:hypothetical protein